jgi:hypothetical protein
MDWSSYEPVNSSDVDDDRAEFLEVLDRLGYIPYDDVNLFDVADNRDEFLKYLAYLHQQGLRPTPHAWLRESAARLMGLESPDAKPPTDLHQAWTLERRRLLVALTWPYRNGGSAPEFSYPMDDESSVSGVYGRPYWNLWSDVRANFAMLAGRIRREGGWDVLAKQWSLSRDVFWESARLDLVKTPFGQLVSPDVADALRGDGVANDGAARAAQARNGFLLTWWDIVSLAECVGFSFEQRDTSEAERRSHRSNGRYWWDRKGLVERIGKATASQELPPDEVHRRITAGGRITPPSAGSKYRGLFDHLDAINFVGTQATVSLRREELDELTSRAVFEEKRIVRGTRGKRGLPNVALSTAPWWYGPWNPDEAGDASRPAATDPSWSGQMRKKSHTRAWMAAGLRAKPNIRQGTLVAVKFEPVNGRESWWEWREVLRAGSFNEVSFKPKR